MLKVKHMTFERVNSFVYLGSLITADNNISVEINNRITLANRSYFGLMNLLKAKNMSRKHKVTVYKTLIKPVLVYGAETWVMRRADELRLGVFERKILRRIYGPIYAHYSGTTNLHRHPYANAIFRSPSSRYVP